MTKRSVIRCILSILMIAYLAVALSFTSITSSADHYDRLIINVDEEEKLGFLTSEEINARLDYLQSKISTIRKCDINTLHIENRIMLLDKVESANCVELNNGALRLDVVPLVPVARVFDISSGRNYYINHAGKRMMANPRFRMDVPVVVGRFDSEVRPTRVLPVISYIEDHPKVGCLVSSYKVQPNGDILIVPIIKGHVINLGDSTGIENKFNRLITFYREVMPVKGWEFYDTLTVKWDGQLVAHKHAFSEPEHKWPEEQEVYIDDESTMVVTHQE